MAEEFVSIVKKSRNGAFYIGIPSEIIQKMNLAPFMAGKMKAEKNSIRIFGFEKTVKIKVNIDEKTIALAKKIMRMEGYGSLDETISNVVHEFACENSKGKTKIVYIYPEEYLKSKHVLISDFEKENFNSPAKARSGKRR